MKAASNAVLTPLAAATWVLRAARGKEAATAAGFRARFGLPPAAAAAVGRERGGEEEGGGEREGPLLWLHAASVGEARTALAVLSRVERWRAEETAATDGSEGSRGGSSRPRLRALLSTGTVGGAAVGVAAAAARRSAHAAADPGAVSEVSMLSHAHVPFDVPWCCERFLRRHSPRAGIFIESELWPSLLGAAAGQGVPMALLDGRMGEVRSSAAAMFL